MNRRSRISRKLHSLAIAAVGVVLVLGMLVGAVFFARPKTSDTERRKLEKFPKWSLSAVLDGSYFKQVSLWYADTYPGRDGLIAMDSRVKSLYGVESKEKLVGASSKAEDIPDAIPDEDSSSDDEALPENVDPPTNKEVDAAVQDAITNGLYIKDGTVYNIFYFTKDGTDRYTSIINACADQLKGTTDLYSLVVPTNVLLLDKDTQKKLGGSDQAQALQYIASKTKKGVHDVYLADIFRKHADEYLFFNTDHHWTADGAYYAYRQFCKAKGIKAHKRSYFKKTDDYKPFLGTFYQTMKDESLKDNPDHVKVYFPNGTNKAAIISQEGKSIDGHVINNMSEARPADKYLAFLGLDPKLATIVNDKVEDDSACLILCDSYGNAFVPFMVDHYHTVYLADFRYAKENICQFCKDHQVQDLIVLGSMKILPANSTLAQLQADLLGR